MGTDLCRTQREIQTVWKRRSGVSIATVGLDASKTLSSTHYFLVGFSVQKRSWKTELTKDFQRVSHRVITRVPRLEPSFFGSHSEGCRKYHRLLTFHYLLSPFPWLMMHSTRPNGQSYTLITRIDK